MTASAERASGGTWRMLPLESEHFGIRIARVTASAAEDMESALQECEGAGVDLAVLRTPAERIDLVHAAEQAEARLMDVMVYLRVDFSRVAPYAPSSSSFAFGGYEPADRAGVMAAAGDAFAGYQGHYHTDPRIPRERADSMYVNWARDCCDGRYGPTAVFVARAADGRIAGFVAAEPMPADGTNVAIGGMAAWAQGRGGYRDLVRFSNAWLREHRGAHWGEYSTQITNVAAQRSVAELGYRPDRAALTFHRWFR